MYKIYLNLNKRTGNYRVLLGLAGLLFGISLWLFPQKIPAIPWKPSLSLLFYSLFKLKL